jgi:hypothetical protein
MKKVIPTAGVSGVQAIPKTVTGYHHPVSTSKKWLLKMEFTSCG